MTQKNDSAMSSPVNISSVTAISDVGSAISFGYKAVVPDTLGNLGDTLFNMGDGDLRLMVNGVTLEAHKYLIKRFSRLKDRILSDTISLEPDEPGVEDFQNTFRILYASVIEGPFNFDHKILASALRIATTYDYPALRNFAIRHLENISLSAVERIRLAREFGLASWEEPAYVELCERDDAITMSEAAVLGLDAFVHVARIREKEQRRKGKEVDATIGGSGGLAEESVEEDPGASDTATNTGKAKGRKRKVKQSTSGSNLDSSKDDQDQAKETNAGTTEKEDVKAISTPSFADAQLPEKYWCATKPDRIAVPVPGCECESQYGSENPRAVQACKCKLPPCAFTAFKNLQTIQSTHNSDIANLGTTLEQVQTTLLSLTTAPKPYGGLDPDEPNETRSAQEEVRKWLASVESGTTTT